MGGVRNVYIKEATSPAISGFFAVMVVLATTMLTSCRASPMTRPVTSSSPALAADLRAHVLTLTETIGERNVEQPQNMAAAVRYVSEQFALMGLIVSTVAAQAEGVETLNMEATLPGTEPGLILIGAHYDCVPGTVGADDNARGVAALIEVARRVSAAGSRPRAGKTLRFVAFTNEEPPHYHTEEMGSLVYARAAMKRGDAIEAAFILEMLGSFSDAPGSQRYPALVGWMFPKTGHFAAVVSNRSNRALVKRFARELRKEFPTESIAAPAAVTGVDFSDHWSFWQVGVPALMVTDTAFFRNSRYHTAADTADTLDYDRLAGLTTALADVISRW
jgi:Zn-dependent M28 family amino/carboxypeptidase